MPSTGLITVQSLAATDVVAGQAASLVSNHAADSLAAHGVVGAVSSYRAATAVIAAHAVSFDANNGNSTPVKVWVPALI